MSSVSKEQVYMYKSGVINCICRRAIFFLDSSPPWGPDTNKMEQKKKHFRLTVFFDVYFGNPVAGRIGWFGGRDWACGPPVDYQRAKSSLGMLSHSVGQSANVKSSIQECWRFCPHVSTDLGDDKCFNPQTKHSLSNHTPSYEWESVRGLSEDGYTSRSLGPTWGGGG